MESLSLLVKREVKVETDGALEMSHIPKTGGQEPGTVLVKSEVKREISDMEEEMTNISVPTVQPLVKSEFKIEIDVAEEIPYWELKMENQKEDHQICQVFSQPGVGGSMEYLGVMVKTEPVEADSDQDLQEDGQLPLHGGDGGDGGVAHTMDHPHDDTPATFQIKLEPDVDEETKTSHCDVPRTMMMMSEETGSDGREVVKVVGQCEMGKESIREEETPPHNGRMVMKSQTQDDDDGDDSQATFEFIKLEKDVPEERAMSHTRKTEKECNQTQNSIQSHIEWSASMRSPGHSAVTTSHRPYPCLECEATFTESGSLKRHMSKHSGEKTYSCTERTATFSKAGNLRAHTQGHRGDNPYSCTECEAEFTESGHLKQHMWRIHKGEKPHACTECEATFAESGYLKAHMRRHRGDKPYSCTECDAAFAESGTLKRHMRRHWGDKPFSCTECKAAFTQSGNLKTHMRSHRGDKPYSCSECQAKFTQSGHWKEHMRIHSGEKPYSCTECEAAFRQSGTLKRHIRRIHRGEKPHAGT